MDRKTVIISGCGFRAASIKELSENIFSNKDVKINIGTATAYTLAASGYDYLLISRTQTKLDLIKKSLIELFPNVSITVCALDLLSIADVSQLVSSLDLKKEYVYVHCAGLSSGSYSLKNDNPYLLVEETPIELPTIEFESVVKSLLVIIKGLLPIFRKQNESRIIVVSSMSSVRSVPYGFSHTSAKAGLHNATRSLSLELNKENIFVSEVMPGAVDTGMYDNEVVQKRVFEMGKMFGYDYKRVPMMPPSAVADVIKMCLESESHILTVNMVGQGQWPNLSS